MPTLPFVILTPEQAETVRGPTADGAALDPLPLSDGSFGLPATVLGDPSHHQHYDLLASLPIEEIEVPEPEPAPPNTVRMAISMRRPDGTSAIAINGEIVAKYDHKALPKPPRQARVVRYQKPGAFHGAKLKVERAKKHIKDLEALILAFKNPSPYRGVTETDEATGEKVYRVFVDKPIPEEMSLVIGDAVHNLRAALDYLVCDMVRAHGKDRVGRPRDPGNAGFKIDRGPKRYEPGAVGKIQGVKPAAERLILRLKAHPGWNGQAWRLNELDIFDKHNLIVTVCAGTVGLAAKAGIFGFFLGPEGDLRIGGGGVPFLSPPGVPTSFRRVVVTEDGVEVHRSAAGVQEEIEVSLDVAFGKGKVAEGEPVLITLYQFTELVERTIALFEKVA